MHHFLTRNPWEVCIEVDRRSSQMRRTATSMEEASGLAIPSFHQQTLGSCSFCPSLPTFGAANSLCSSQLSLGSSFPAVFPHFQPQFLPTLPGFLVLNLAVPQCLSGAEFPCPMVLSSLQVLLAFYPS